MSTQETKTGATVVLKLTPQLAERIKAIAQKDSRSVRNYLQVFLEKSFPETKPAPEVDPWKNNELGL